MKNKTMINLLATVLVTSAVSLQSVAQTALLADAIPQQTMRKTVVQMQAAALAKDLPKFIKVASRIAGVVGAADLVTSLWYKYALNKDTGAIALDDAITDSADIYNQTGGAFYILLFSPNVKQKYAAFSYINDVTLKSKGKSGGGSRPSRDSGRGSDVNGPDGERGDSRDRDYDHGRGGGPDDRNDDRGRGSGGGGSFDGGGYSRDNGF